MQRATAAAVALPQPENEKQSSLSALLGLCGSIFTAGTAAFIPPDALKVLEDAQVEIALMDLFAKRSQELACDALGLPLRDPLRVFVMARLGLPMMKLIALRKNEGPDRGRVEPLPEPSEVERPFRVHPPTAEVRASADLAESEGFEPPKPFGSPDFESGAFSRSASSPGLAPPSLRPSTLVSLLSDVFRDFVAPTRAELAPPGPPN
jgi:hypothetical protein